MIFKISNPLQTQKTNQHPDAKTDLSYIKVALVAVSGISLFTAAYLYQRNKNAPQRPQHSVKQSRPESSTYSSSSKLSSSKDTPRELDQRNTNNSTQPASVSSYYLVNLQEQTPQGTPRSGQQFRPSQTTRSATNSDNGNTEQRNDTITHRIIGEERPNPITPATQPPTSNCIIS